MQPFTEPYLADNNKPKKVATTPTIKDPNLVL